MLETEHRGLEYKVDLIISELYEGTDYCFQDGELGGEDIRLTLMYREKQDVIVIETIKADGWASYERVNEGYARLIIELNEST